MPDLLIELFSEEIPARMQPRARDDLKALVTNGLVEAGLTYASAGAFSTPRRLTLAVEGLSAESPARREERKGPRADAPEKALEGFLRSTGLSRDQLERRADKKAEVWFAVIEHPGRAAPEIVAEVLDKTIRTFPWPKSMRWGEGTLRWVRPLHSILCLLTDDHGAQVVPLTVEGITSTDTTHGHRFLAPGRIAVTSFEDYAAKLRRAHVMLDPEERAAHILQDAQNLAFAAGMELVPDPGLLTELAGLVEWPVPLMGKIAPEFLHLPPEVLQTSMKEHQKFFSVKNPKTGGIEGFVTVANTETADHGATILKGNQKVLSARLSDARFFWDNDLRIAKAGMGDWLDGLSHVTFQRQLGSQAERIARIATLAHTLAPLVGADPDTAARAARLAKADLRSEMVGEFPELQGKMGRYYALESGEPPAIADAARDHYAPLGPSDDVPAAPVSIAVALADKLDTLTGFWAIDEKPTGSKDPFALRRAALGVIRLILTNDLRLHLAEAIGHGLVAAFLASYETEGSDGQGGDVVNTLLHIARRDYGLAPPVTLQGKPVTLDEARLSENGLLATSVESGFQIKLADLLGFFHDRLKVHLRDEGIRHDVIDACLAMDEADDLTLLVRRARSLSGFLETDDGTNLLQGFKRANNILIQAEERDGVEYSYGADPKYAETDEERALFAALDKAEAIIAPALSHEDFDAAMQALAGLRAPIDAFFETVQINTDNSVVRRNRLNLLHTIRQSCAQVADLTKVEG